MVGPRPLRSISVLRRIDMSSSFARQCSKLGARVIRLGLWHASLPHRVSHVRLVTSDYSCRGCRALLEDNVPVAPQVSATSWPRQALRTRTWHLVDQHLPSFVN